MGFSDIIADAVKTIPVSEVLRERLAFADQQFAALERKATELTLKVSELETENKDLRFEIQQRAAQIHKLTPSEPPGDKCPYCNRNTGKLQEIKLQPGQRGMLGLKEGFYKCANPDCGKNYEKDMP